MKSLNVLTTLAVAFWMTASAFGVTMSGQVENTSGVGIPNVNIDLKDAQGDDVTIFNDTTNAGGFFNVTVPTGTYDVIFNTPTGTRYVWVVLHDVVISGNINLGVIVMQSGFFLSGHVQNQSGQPLFNVDLDIEISATGVGLDLKSDNTDSNGNFSLLIPAGTYDVLFDPSALTTFTYAPDQRLDVVVSSDKSLGNITLVPGVHLIGRVLSDTFSPVINADTDVINATTGIKLYTPGDNTGSDGRFDVVVPVGTYHVEIEPPIAAQLVAKRISNVVVSGAKNLGDIVLEKGVFLSGRVRNAVGVGIAGVDVDVVSARTGAEVITPSDNTDANGNFIVVVPEGLYHVIFTPLAGSGFVKAYAHFVSIDVKQEMRVKYYTPTQPVVTWAEK
jgi:hypothetical protein